MSAHRKDRHGFVWNLGSLCVHVYAYAYADITKCHKAAHTAFDAHTVPMVPFPGGLTLDTPRLTLTDPPINSYRPPRLTLTDPPD